jgi:hypothetical protein
MRALSLAVVLRQRDAERRTSSGMLFVQYRQTFRAYKLSRAASVVQVCEADVRKVCGGAKRAVDILGCMKPRLTEVSKRGMDALATVGVATARSDEPTAFEA